MLCSHKGFINVDLSDNKIPSSVTSNIANLLQENKVLEVLKLDRNDFGDDGIETIAKSLTQNKTLR